MNKKLLAKKIFNFKKNKKNISEERSQLDEFLGTDLKTDKGLGDLQSGLSTASTIASFGGFIPPIAVASRFTAALLGAGAYFVNKKRQELDAKGVVPSETGPEGLAMQGSLIKTAGIGLVAMAAPRSILRAIPHWSGGSLARIAGTPGGQKWITGIAAAPSLLSTEWAAKNADPLTDRLGLPNIPGISKRLTKKAPYGTVAAFDVSRAPTQLELVAAANASQN
jgi:hypothetical protein